MGRNIDPIQAIHADIAIRTHGEDIGMFTVKSANQTVADAALRPVPRDLFMGLWYEGEAACLFADSNLGKSIFAVQIADGLAKDAPVLYVDCELSDKQFQLRYTNEITGKQHRFPADLFRAEINPATFDSEHYEEQILSQIEEIAEKKNCRSLIIDNIGYLCNASDKSVDAGSFMVKLMSLKKRRGWSVLVIAHTPKRNLSSPITQNDLAGSKRLYNYFDSVFAIGQSARDANIRYVKQLKARSTEILYGSANVLVYEILKADDFLQFSFIDFGKEYEHLKEVGPDDVELRRQRVQAMKESGKSVREAAKELGLSKSMVGRIYKELSCPTVPASHAGTVGQQEEESHEGD